MLNQSIKVEKSRRWGQWEKRSMAKTESRHDHCCCRLFSSRERTWRIRSYCRCDCGAHRPRPGLCCRPCWFCRSRTLALFHAPSTNDNAVPKDSLVFTIRRGKASSRRHQERGDPARLAAAANANAVLAGLAVPESGLVVVLRVVDAVALRCLTLQRGMRGCGVERGRAAIGSRPGRKMGLAPCRTCDMWG